MTALVYIFPAKQATDLDVVFVEQHLTTVFSIIINAEFKSDSLQDAAILMLLMTSQPPVSFTH